MHKHKLFTAILTTGFILCFNLACSDFSTLSLDNKESFLKESSCKAGQAFKHSSPKYETLKGEVKHLAISYSDGSHGDQYQIHTNSNEIHDLIFSEDFQANQLPLNKKVVLAVNKVEENKYRVYSQGSQLYFTNLEGCVEKQNRSDTRKDIGLYKIIDPGEKVTSYMERSLREDAAKLEAYYTLASKGKWDVSVKSYFLESECVPGPPAGCKNEVNTMHRDNNHSHNYKAIWGGHKSGACGHAYLNTRTSWTYDRSDCDIGTVIHEVGHNFSLGHANKLRSNGEIAEYGDKTSVMGISNTKSPLNAANLIHLDLYDEESLLEVEKTKKVFLAPIEWRLRDLYSGEYQQAVVHKDDGGIGATYVVSIRQTKGPFTIPSSEANKVQIHTFQNSTTTRSLLLEQLEDDGASNVFVDEKTDVKIELIGIKDGIAEVDIYYNAKDPKPAAQDFPRGPLPKPIEKEAITYSHSGLWSNPLYPNQGFDIQVLPEKQEVIAYWYTYSQKGDGFGLNSSKKRYYIGHGAIVDGVAHLPMITTEGGAFDKNDAAIIKEIGEAKLYFQSCNSAVLQYKTSEHGRGSINLSRLAGNDTTCDKGTPLPENNHYPNGKTEKFQAGLTGSWINPEISRQGFSLSVLEATKHIVMFWYTYENNGPQKWLMLDGGYDLSNDSSELTIYETSDGYFKSPEFTEVNVWGKAELKVESCSKLYLSYQNKSGRVSGDIPLSRLTPNVHCTNELP